MKKFVTVLLVAILALGCVFALAACKKEEDPTPEDKVLVDNEAMGYRLTGAAFGWSGEPTADMYDADDETKLDTDHALVFEPVALSDARVASIKNKLTDVKYLYVVEYEYNFAVETNGEPLTTETIEGDEVISYAIKENDPVRTFDNYATVKVVRFTYSTNPGTGAADYTAKWIPDYGDNNWGKKCVSLTPDTLYVPPFQAEEAWTNSGTWGSNPVLLGNPGTYRIVFAWFNDNTWGLGAIPVEA